MEVLADATNVIAEGEVLQLMNMHNAAINRSEYLHVIRSKTAKLFGAGSRVGAILAKASLNRKGERSVGRPLARPFRSSTTCSTTLGDANVMGKEPGDDLHEGNSLALISRCSRATKPACSDPGSAIETGAVDKLEDVIAIVGKPRARVLASGGRSRSPARHFQRLHLQEPMPAV